MPAWPCRPLSGLVPATQTQGRAVGRSENQGVNGGHNLPPLILMITAAHLLSGYFEWKQLSYEWGLPDPAAHLLSSLVPVTQTHSPRASE